VLNDADHFNVISLGIIIGNAIQYRKVITIIPVLKLKKKLCVLKVLDSTIKPSDNDKSAANCSGMQ